MNHVVIALLVFTRNGMNGGRCARHCSWLANDRGADGGEFHMSAYSQFTRIQIQRRWCSKIGEMSENRIERRGRFDSLAKNSSIFNSFEIFYQTKRAIGLFAFLLAFSVKVSFIKRLGSKTFYDFLQQIPFRHVEIHQMTLMIKSRLHCQQKLSRFPFELSFFSNRESVIRTESRTVVPYRCI